MELWYCGSWRVGASLMPSVRLLRPVLALGLVGLVTAAWVIELCRAFKYSVVEESRASMSSIVFCACDPLV